MRRLVGASAVAWLALGPAPALASTIPLPDQTPGTRCLTVGATDLTIHGALDLALEGRARGWSIGVLGGFDHANPLRRDSHTMVAVRTMRQLGTLWPFTLAAMLSAGVNAVDADAPLPSRTEQRFASDFLPWLQPAVVVSVHPFDRCWLRGTFGPVLGRFTAGAFAMPWMVPNLELAYRVFENQEVVLGGAYGSPYGLAWRAAF